MGRQRNHPWDRNAGGSVDKEAGKKIEERLGLSKSVCTKCDKTNPEDADKCRGCGHTNLRPKKSSFTDA